MEKPRLTRRQFILVLATLSGSLTLTGIYRLLSKAAALTKDNPYLPLLAKARGVASTPTATVTHTPVTTTDATPSPTKTRTLTPTVNGTATPVKSPTTTQTNQPPGPLAGKVIHIRNTNATNWDGNIPFYNSSAVNQSVVNTMVFEGLKNLTNQTSWGNIWQVLFGRVQPGGYTPGQKIAIKVNFNDSDRDNNNCSTHNNTIDALPQPVIALLNGLVAAGVQPTDVIVYDATGGSYGNTYPGRIIPDYFRNPITNAYSGVSFVGLNDCNVTPASFGKDPSLTVTFNDPNNYLLDRHLADILYNATYLINMPILKGHGGNSDIPVTLSFKNHFGSIDYVYGGPGPHDNLHEFVSLPQGQYHSNYSPLVDINKNPNIKNKTILIAGDGLYGSWAVSPEQNWTIFGNDAANSLFFAVDPVAVDCVMTDLIHAEGWFSDLRGYDFLFCAQEAGLGLCEGTRANPGGKPLQQPFGSGYSTISYTRIDL
jgi:Domain of unknown function (DUF362)